MTSFILKLPAWLKPKPKRLSLYEEFQLWKLEGIVDDVLWREEYKPHVEQAKANLNSDATQDELLAEVETVLSKLKS